MIFFKRNTHNQNNKNYLSITKYNIRFTLPFQTKEPKLQKLQKFTAQYAYKHINAKLTKIPKLQKLFENYKNLDIRLTQSIEYYRREIPFLTVLAKF